MRSSAFHKTTYQLKLSMFLVSSLPKVVCSRMLVVTSNSNVFSRHAIIKCLKRELFMVWDCLKNSSDENLSFILLTNIHKNNNKILIDKVDRLYRFMIRILLNTTLTIDRKLLCTASMSFKITLNNGTLLTDALCSTLDTLYISETWEWAAVRWWCGTGSLRVEASA